MNTSNALKIEFLQAEQSADLAVGKLTNRLHDEELLAQVIYEFTQSSIIMSNAGFACALDKLIYGLASMNPEVAVYDEYHSPGVALLSHEMKDQIQTRIFDVIAKLPEEEMKKKRTVLIETTTGCYLKFPFNKEEESCDNEYFKTKREEKEKLKNHSISFSEWQHKKWVEKNTKASSPKY
ncbi:hypothetical protein [Duganella qianjiadongensis]|uniref:Uncharacterized protein n=1 Tax=Duganella qianjiadongensis TaxID=2692176 RepID=A0ABW9VL47_9BURK|nr:hypothetical protein [Duganella qianjiadongensis]MYM40158.1 hypothetical protein [Duganella qianjiadongensis]